MVGPARPVQTEAERAYALAALACVDGIVIFREPRLTDNDDPAVRSFKRRWGNPPVVVVFHAVKDGVRRTPDIPETP